MAYPNLERVRRIGDTYYAGDAEEALRDVLADARHFAAYHSIDFNAADRMAAIHFGDETDGPLPDPPAELADAWRRFREGGDVSQIELRKLDEWRAECAEEAGF